MEERIAVRSPRSASGAGFAVRVREVAVRKAGAMNSLLKKCRRQGKSFSFCFCLLLTLGGFIGSQTPPKSMHLPLCPSCRRSTRNKRACAPGARAMRFGTTEGARHLGPYRRLDRVLASARLDVALGSGSTSQNASVKSKGVCEIAQKFA